MPSVFCPRVSLACCCPSRPVAALFCISHARRYCSRLTTLLRSVHSLMWCLCTRFVSLVWACVEILGLYSVGWWWSSFLSEVRHHHLLYYVISAYTFLNCNQVALWGKSCHTASDRIGYFNHLNVELYCYSSQITNKYLKKQNIDDKPNQIKLGPHCKYRLYNDTQNSSWTVLSAVISYFSY